MSNIWIISSLKSELTQLSILFHLNAKKDLQALARRSLNLKRVNEEKLDQQSHPFKVIEF